MLQSSPTLPVNVIGGHHGANQFEHRDRNGGGHVYSRFLEYSARIIQHRGLAGDLLQSYHPQTRNYRGPHPRSEQHLQSALWEGEIEREIEQALTDTGS